MTTSREAEQAMQAGDFARVHQIAREPAEQTDAATRERAQQLAQQTGYGRAEIAFFAACAFAFAIIVAVYYGAKG